MYFFYHACFCISTYFLLSHHSVKPKGKKLDNRSKPKRGQKRTKSRSPKRGLKNEKQVEKRKNKKTLHVQ